MKVVLFCGGLGTRLREYSETIPKPMVSIGHRPMLWHLMKYYAHYGHKDFILCLGYRGDLIRQYFLNYDECISNDFVLSNGGRESHSTAATSRTGGSPSSIPGSTPISASASGPWRSTSTARRGSWPTTATASAICRCPSTWSTSRAGTGSRLSCRVRPNQSFHVVSMDPTTAW